ncbi:hypothetical protein BH10CYA1_BH10CYA1_63550 [soil metagenome]
MDDSVIHVVRLNSLDLHSNVEQKGEMREAEAVQSFDSDSLCWSYGVQVLGDMDVMSTKEITASRCGSGQYE